MLPKSAKKEFIMTLDFKSTYTTAIRERYFRSKKSEKSAILDEFCEVTGFHRKHAIRILSTGHKTTRKLSGRKRYYSDESIVHLKKLWHVMGRICSKKMVAAFPVWLNFYQAQGFNFKVRSELLAMSYSTIDRYLKAYKTQFARRKRTGTVKAKRFMNVIPIKKFDEKNIGPGHLQADTVAHCGSSLSGQFIWTLTVTDEYSGWTENRASLGKDACGILTAICQATWKYPMDIKSFNTDSGTEFINHKLQEYLDSRGILFTRSRPYRKNDNCYVEQKNFTHVREIFGYKRYDKEELVQAMNQIYADYFNVLNNFFVPQLKCVEVTRIGSKYRRKYDKPKTPYQRLLESSQVSNFQKDQLIKKYKSLNPIQLKKDINNLMKRFKKIRNGDIEWKYKFVA